MDRVTKDGLLETVRGDRARFDAIVAGVSRDRLTEPILPGGWSVKDVLAHIAWGDREAIGVIRSRALVGSELWEIDQDARNEAVVRESRALSLDEVLDDYRGSFAEYVAALGQLSDEDLNEPDRIRGLTDQIPGWLPWRVLYDPGHYDEHGRTIESALGRREQDSASAEDRRRPPSGG
jgi:uncharacterized protein (TIGR03083 family)